MNNENTKNSDDLVPKILLVDDMKTNLMLIAAILKPLPASVIMAQSGQAALDVLEKHECAMVLLDVEMPDMDGFQTAKLIRQKKQTTTLPIIFLTGNKTEDASVFKGYESGAVDYLFKPINEEILIAKVKFFLDMYKQKVRRLDQVLMKLKKTQRMLEKRNAELTRLAHYDTLTKLPNRLQFEKEMERTISDSKRHNKSFAVLFLDLDGFKKINDTLGHHVGDLVLIEAGKRISNVIRTEDFFSRIGGDEFASVIADLKHPREAGYIADKIIAAFKDSMKIAEHLIDITPSIGVACYPDGGKDFNTLIRNADIAMYRAKNKGHNQCQFFTKALEEEYTNISTVERALKQAVQNNELYLVYQPVIELATQRIVGMESLIRWHHPKLGDVSPADFIPIAEETGLILGIGDWVIHEACLQFSKWCEAGHDDLLYAMNVSPGQLRRGDVVKVINSLFETIPLLPKCLEVELTEGAVMEDAETATTHLDNLHNVGVRISIDDFGTGYSSLGRLRTLPVQTLKIDRSFVMDIGKDENDTIIVKSVLALANSLGLNVIAEGIETEEQLAFLVENNCPQGQGFYFYKPMKAAEMTALLKKITPP